MTPIEFTKQMKILSLSYSKDFKEEQIKLWYEYFKSIKKETFEKALNKIIITNKYMPSIAEILEKCKLEKKDHTLEIIEKMKQDGYFKNELEYNKILNWFNEGIIPNWFKEDMKEYSNKLLGNNTMKLIENN